MPPAQLPLIAKIWFALVTPIVLIDGLFVLNRQPVGSNAPHPLANTVPFNFWLIYEKYDRRYAPNDDAFVVAQSYLNLMEIALGLVAIALSFLKKDDLAIKLAALVCCMTFYKTVLYFVMDIVEGGKYTKHNSMKDQIQFVIIPSSFWLIVPAYIPLRLPRLAEAGHRGGAKEAGQEQEVER
ncbi:hypothetical protein AGDE_05194 [Angomonas deanei]|nr:hypothetical protein AGDE_05194 [Angomonas deanei]|eukprot:EPY38735.1 hypothetical protein AGDE_05194 [Angomonas deanei]